MKLVTYRIADRRHRPGALLAGGLVVDLDVLRGRLDLELPDGLEGVPGLLALGEPGRRPLAEALESLAADPARGLEEGWVTTADAVELLPPTGPRPYVQGCGGIFVSHLVEMGVPPVPNPQPDGFVVNPNILVGSGRPIELPTLAPDMVDYEGEFCVVFGRPSFRVAAEDAWDHVAGYTLFNDVSARDLNAGFTSDDAAERVAAYAGVIRYKSFPTFGPIGPCVTTSDELVDVEKAELTTRVNGELRQQDLVGNLGLSIPEVVERVTRFHAFAPGDVMTLGTPAGVGYAREPRVFLRPGDVVEISVDAIGSLRNPVVAAA